MIKFIVFQANEFCCQTKCYLLLINNRSEERREDHDFIQFPVHAIKLLKLKDIELAIVSSVVDKRMDEDVIQEVSLDWTTSSMFEEIDID